jgi:hypothetical protein
MRPARRSLCCLPPHTKLAARAGELFDEPDALENLVFATLERQQPIGSDGRL